MFLQSARTQRRKRKAELTKAQDLMTLLPFRKSAKEGNNEEHRQNFVDADDVSEDTYISDSSMADADHVTEDISDSVDAVDDVDEDLYDFLIDENEEFDHIPTSREYQSSNEEKIFQFFVKHNLTREVGNDLLLLLKSLNFQEVQFLPKDIRTIVSRMCQLEEPIFKEKTDDYSYVYFGIEKTLNLDKLPDNYFFNINSQAIKLTVNTDGVKLTRSSNIEFWPVIAYIDDINLHYEKFIIALYCGKGKPATGDILMKHFTEEVQKLMKNGIVVRERTYSFQMEKICADAPAISLILDFKGHGGFQSCVYCLTHGEYHRGRVCFPDSEAPPRILNDFRTSKSALLNITNFNPRIKFAIDYQHLICLGIVKKLVNAAYRGAKSMQRKRAILQPPDLALLDERIKFLRSLCPNDFARKPRPLSTDGVHYKSTEWRQLVFYYGPVIFFDVLPIEEYENFLILHCCLRVLGDEKLAADEELLKSVETLLKKFVNDCMNMFGPWFITHNMHVLVHLVDHVRIYGNLDKFSTFPFEDYNYQIKQYVKSGNNPLQQFVNGYRRVLFLSDSLRKSIHRSSTNNDVTQTRDDYKLSKEIKGKDRIMHCDSNDSEQKFLELRTVNGRLFQCNLENKGDRYGLVVSDDKYSIVKIAYFLRRCERTFIVGQKFRKMRPFYTYPTSSENLGTYVVSKLSETFSQFPISNLQKKLYAMPFKDKEYVMMTLLN